MKEASETDQHQGILAQLALSGKAGTVHSMDRPPNTRIESAGRWEIEVDGDAREVRGVRIYLPNFTAPSRAFYPYPVHLNTAQVQRLVMRWLNQIMDMHYGLCSLERIYIQKNYRSLSDDIRATMQQFVSHYQGVLLDLHQISARWSGDAGLPLLNGDAPKVGFTATIDFVAALSTPEDRYVIRAFAGLDHLIMQFDKAYLTMDLSQEEYVHGTGEACRLVERMMVEHLQHAKTQVRAWLSEADQLSDSGSN